MSAIVCLWSLDLLCVVVGLAGDECERVIEKVYFS